MPGVGERGGDRLARELQLAATRRDAENSVWPMPGDRRAMPSNPSELIGRPTSSTAAVGTRAPVLTVGGRRRTPTSTRIADADHRRARCPTRFDTIRMPSSRSIERREHRVLERRVLRVVQRARSCRPCPAPTARRHLDLERGAVRAHRPRADAAASRTRRTAGRRAGAASAASQNDGAVLGDDRAPDRLHVTKR